MDIKLGTRGSKLALWQANHIKYLLEQKVNSIKVEIIVIKTKGDLIQDKALPNIGGKGLFTKEIEEALLEEKIHIAVHSLKDLPSELPNGLKYAGSPVRNDHRDCFISTKWESIAEVPNKGRIATGSMRRKALIHEINPKIQCGGLRGNIATRLRKLEEHKWDGIIMAAAALHRLEMADRITEYLDPKVFVPSVGQGAIGLEINANQSDINEVIDQIIDRDTVTCVTAERAFMHQLGGGCSVPIGAWAKIIDNQLELIGYFSSLDGKQSLRESMKGPLNSPKELGDQLADIFRSHGVLDWIN